MARPLKQGLDYFQMDVDFFTDIKVRRIKKDCGPASVSILLCLLCNIYRDGYYIGWNEDVGFVIAEMIGVTEGAVLETISKAVSVGFFNGDMFSRYKILTSAGIQKRYMFVVRNSKLKRESIHENYQLLVSSEESTKSSEETLKPSEETNENTEESTQSIAKHSKEYKNSFSSQPQPVGDEEAASNSKKLSKSRKKHKYEHDSRYYKAAAWLRDAIKKTAKKSVRDPTENNLQEWADDFRLLAEYDNIPWSDIRDVLMWTMADSFWCTNIQSGRKFREQYTQLVSKMTQYQGSGKNDVATHENTGYEMAVDVIARQEAKYAKNGVK